MKKRSLALIMSAMLAMVLCISAISLNCVAKEKIKSRTFLTAETDTYDEALTLFFTKGKKKLVGITDETHFYKDAGYTVDQLEEFDVDSVYPGFSDMEYASKEIIDEDDCVTVICKFMDLDEYWKQAVDDGILTINEGQDVEKATYMDAESVCNSAIAAGHEELDEDAVEEYGYHVDYEELN